MCEIVQDCVEVSLLNFSAALNGLFSQHFEIVKKLAPSSVYLFGGKLAEVAKNLKDSVQLNPLSPAPRFGLGLGRGKSKGAPFKGYQGQGPSRGAAVAGYLRGTGSYRGYKGRPSKFGKKLAKCKIANY